MSYIILVTTGNSNLSEQEESARQWVRKHGHTIVTTIHDDKDAALRMRDTLGGEVVYTTPVRGPAFLANAQGDEYEEPEAQDAPVKAVGKAAPSLLRPAVTASAPPPVGGPIKGPAPDVEEVAAPAPKVAKKGARRSGPTTKHRKELDRLKPIFEELSGQSAKGCAKILNERQVALPSGKAGTWQGTQVTRVRKHLEDIHGKPDSPTT